MAAQFRIRPTQRTSPAVHEGRRGERQSCDDPVRGPPRPRAKYALPVLRHALRGARMQLVDAR